MNVRVMQVLAVMMNGCKPIYLLKVECGSVKYTLVSSITMITKNDTFNLPKGAILDSNPLTVLAQIIDVKDITHYVCANKHKSIYFNSSFIYVDNGIESDDDDECSINLGCHAYPEITTFDTKGIISFNTMNGFISIKKIKDDLELLM